MSLTITPHSSSVPETESESSSSRVQASTPSSVAPQSPTSSSDWTNFDTYRLLQIVYDASLKTFEDIAKEFCCTPELCKEKYFEVMDAETIDDSWTKEEDTLLLEGESIVVDTEKCAKWTMISKAYLRGRRDEKACKKRHAALLKNKSKVEKDAKEASANLVQSKDKVEKVVKTRLWTEEQDRQLTEAVAVKKMPYTEIANQLFNDKFTPNQCLIRYRQLSKHSADPAIEPVGKRVVWSPEEDKLLQEAVDEKKMSWVAISKELFKGKFTAYQCSYHYNNVICNPTHAEKREQWLAKWTEEDDGLLKEAVEVKKLNWLRISNEVFPGKYSSTQCRYRYTSHINPSSIDHGPWTNAQDILLKEGAAKFNLDWEQISTNVFAGKRTPEQCSKRFLNHVNPAILATAWDKEDDKLLLGITGKQQDWNEISIKIFAGRRTPKQCRDRHISHIACNIVHTAWTEEEDKQLIEAVKKHGEDWAEIAYTAFKGSRTPLKCSQRHLKLHTPSTPKTAWTEEDDTKLKKLLETDKNDWQVISKELFQDKRTAKECQDRYEEHLSPIIIRGNWTEEENQKLLEAIETLGNNWKKIAQEVFKGTRTARQCNHHHVRISDRAAIKGNWTEEENQKLKDAVNAIGKNWKKISQETFKGTRSAHQCQMHYTRSLDPTLCKWTPEEDAQLKEAAEKQKRDWPSISKEVFQEKKSAEQCQERYEEYFDPKINKGSWTEEENQKLKDAVKTYGKRWKIISKEVFQGTRTTSACSKHFSSYVNPSLQNLWTKEDDDKLRAAFEKHKEDWNAVAKELGTEDKTASTCKMRYKLLTIAPKKKAVWSPEEDKLLQEGIEKFKKDWQVIAREVFKGKYSADDCYNRDCKLNPATGVMSKWTEEEDQKLRDGVAVHGTKNWQLISEDFLDEIRSSSQCKKRYLNHLDPALKKGSFTKEEDARLRQAVENHGQNWKTISREVFKGSKSGDQCKHRYKNLRSGEYYQRLVEEARANPQNSDDEIELADGFDE